MEMFNCGKKYIYTAEKCKQKLLFVIQIHPEKLKDNLCLLLYIWVSSPSKRVAVEDYILRDINYSQAPMTPGKMIIGQLQAR